MSKILLYVLAGLGGLIIIGLITSEVLTRNVKEPPFTVLKQDGAFQLRRYAPFIVAQVTVDGPREIAIKQGFRLLADYIFGRNTPQAKIDMTAPVIQQKIDMTAPVLQQETLEKNTWLVRFVMPETYTMETLPQPNNSKVTLLEIPEKTYLTIRFSGRSTQENLKTHLERLKNHMDDKGVSAKGEPIYAFYNPPWTLPFLRRNEIMVEIDPQ